MDFGELLHTAKKNEQAKPQIQYYSTKFAAPKKEQRTKTLSINVQKFLARKEAEEKGKQQEALERKNKLLALRSQDKKATRRVNVMLKRTKSANQSVIADALDDDNTAVTLAGPSQPDEDDYGYVSQESSALYIKMMEKYSKMPEEPKFPTEKKKVSTNLNSTKDRVRAALEREREEALLPHRRKRKHTDSGATGGDSEPPSEVCSEPEPEKKEPIKPKFKPAPMVNFSDLLKLAEKKQFEPVIIEPKKEDDERPLTKKQKKEMDREREWRERKEAQARASLEKPVGLNKIPKINNSTQNYQKIPKKGDNLDLKKSQGSADHQNSKILDKNSNIAKNDMSSKSVKLDGKQPLIKGAERNTELSKKIIQQQRMSNSMGNSNIRFPSEKPKLEVRQSSSMPPPKPKSLQNERPKGFTTKDSQQQKNPIKVAERMHLGNSVKSKQLPSDNRAKQVSPSDFKSKQQLPSNSVKPKQFPQSDLKPKQFPPKDLKPKQFPPPEERRNLPPKGLKKRPPVNKRRIIDDEDYDSEMDDFIDDGPEGAEDYSKYISEIFGYDKRRYQQDDDDVDNMESSFAQQMKEEVISTKIGIMEDLEDMRQEEQAKKQKLLMKKRRF